ncbi:MAG: hypothetical protein QF890_13465 [Myxococcota bacterium]|nr:hypothetical protein [Myxococcota bacterium]MDP7075489.1 hypothetical protein [Myxococcota bacterium]MDP7299652.1 hypothetical protein [Myxococcota bacterium]MDP7433569.1 hypothetical protein [Myxococcota bacterium]HJO23600.1 hypothetical protein [Myxococcota bacterium]
MAAGKKTSGGGDIEAKCSIRAMEAASAAEVNATAWYALHAP